MLLWINPIEVASLPGKVQLLDALSSLGEAGYHGRHAVVGSRTLLKQLAALADLSRPARAYFAWISEAVTQYGGVIANAEQVIVDIEAAAPIFLGGQWRIPLGLLDEPEYLGVAEILCENANDCEMLRSFAELYVRRNLPICSVRIKPVAGGGNTTGDLLRSAMASVGPFTLCVVDSDRELPEGRRGQTAKRCAAAYTPSWRIELKILEARELENIVPQAVVVHVLEASGRNAGVARNINGVHRDISRFACFKTGENVCRFHAVPTGHAGIGRVRVALSATSLHHPQFIHCGGECAECECQLIPALGENFLRDVTAWMSSMSNRRLVPVANEWPDEFEQVTKRVTSFGLAFPRRNV